MIELYLVFRFVKGCCHGNKLILGKCHERQLITLAFFALSLENELQYHCQNVRINSADDVMMWLHHKNLVNFCPVTPEIRRLMCIPTYVYLAKIDLHIYIICPAAIQNVMQHWNADGCINSGNDQATLGINLVGF